VRLDFVNLLPPRDRELTCFRLLLSAWEMLNRQRADAAIALHAIAELAEARAQVSMCESAAGAFMRLGEQQRREMTDSQGKRLYDLSISCEQAANIAIRLMAIDRNQSDPVLGWAIRGLAGLELMRSSAQGLFDVWFAAIEAKGQSESIEALQASLLYLRAGPRPALNDPRHEERLARVRAARAAHPLRAQSSRGRNHRGIHVAGR